MNAASQSWPRASRPLPIVILGAGGIVQDAHLPAYRRLGLDVRGIFDIDIAKARTVAQRFGIETVYESAEKALGQRDVVHDCALPPQAIEETLARLPRGAAVLIQKPLGVDLASATRLRALARERGLRAAMNFQLRFSPQMLELAERIRRGELGELLELEVRVVCRMPWELWPFLRALPRLEILVHSIHYLDLLRHLAGDPRRVHARCVKHPSVPELAATRTSAILDYGGHLRCTLSIHHHHEHGPAHEASELRVEGTRGAAVAVMGVNLDYPRGRPDRLELVERGGAWREIALRGNWFTEAFEGPISNLQRFVTGEDAQLVSPIEDGWRTMRLVEALYESDAQGGHALPPDPEAA